MEDPGDFTNMVSGLAVALAEVRHTCLQATAQADTAGEADWPEDPELRRLVSEALERARDVLTDLDEVDLAPLQRAGEHWRGYIEATNRLTDLGG